MSAILDNSTIKILEQLPERTFRLLLANALIQSPEFKALFYAFTIALILWGVSRIIRVHVQVIYPNQ